MPQLPFELDDVRVTPYIAQFGGTSYQIAGISSVRARKVKSLSRLAVFVFFLGAAGFACAIASSGNRAGVNAHLPEAIIAVGIMIHSFLVQLVLPRRVIKLTLTIHGSNVEVLTSKQANPILRTKQAIEAAFIIQAERFNRNH